MFWKKHKWKIIVPVCLIALAAFLFWYGGDAPGLQGWKVEKRPAATETPDPLNTKAPQTIKDIANSLSYGMLLFGTGFCVLLIYLFVSLLRT